MSERVILRKINEVFMRVEGNPGILMELSDDFSFRVENYKYNPLYKAGRWDGYIRLVNRLTGVMYVGLITRVYIWMIKHGYEVDVQGFDLENIEFSINEAWDFVNTLDLPTWLDPREYQVETLKFAVAVKRGIILSPTASGKSFMIYLIISFLQEKTLIIVPTTSLVEQMKKDLISYGLDPKEIHGIYSKKEKHLDCRVTVTTWQSIKDMPAEWYEDIRLVIGDEVHGFKAKSLTGIMEKLTGVPYKFGFTGTLDGIQCNQLVLEGLFGPIERVATTLDLMEKGHISNLKIKSLLLHYPEWVKSIHVADSYYDEMDYLVSCPERNRSIIELIKGLKGNTIVLFQYVQKHGRVLHEMLLKEDIGRPVYFITGEVKTDERERVRELIEDVDDAVIFASFGVFSTGINVKKLHNLVFASPTKSVVRVLQSIGRILRKYPDKTANLYDIGDDLFYLKRKNHTLRHFYERQRIYTTEGFQKETLDFDLKIEKKHD